MNIALLREFHAAQLLVGLEKCSLYRISMRLYIKGYVCPDDHKVHKLY